MIRDLIRNTDRAVLRKVIESVDGHTIYHPNHFMEKGLDGKIVAAFIRTHESDARDPKSTIFRDGKAIASMEGVYGLSVLEFIASTFEVDSWKMGRGSRAAHLAEQLVEKFDKSE